MRGSGMPADRTPDTCTTGALVDDGALARRPGIGGSALAEAATCSCRVSGARKGCCSAAAGVMRSRGSHCRQRDTKSSSAGVALSPCPRSQCMHTVRCTHQGLSQSPRARLVPLALPVMQVQRVVDAAKEHAAALAAGQNIVGRHAQYLHLEHELLALVVAREQRLPRAQLRHQAPERPELRDIRGADTLFPHHMSIGKP